MSKGVSKTTRAGKTRRWHGSRTPEGAGHLVAFQASVVNRSPTFCCPPRPSLVEDLHLLLPVEVPHWVCNHYGQKMTLNLQWTLPVGETEGQLPAVEGAAEDAGHEFAPPDSYNKTPPEEKHQKPAAGGSAGVLTTLFT